MPLEWIALDAAVGLVLAGRLHNPLATAGILAAAAAKVEGLDQLRSADAPWPEMSDFTGSGGAPYLPRGGA